MRSLPKSFLLIPIVLVSLVGSVLSESAVDPKPTAIPQSRTKATPEQKPTPTSTEEQSTNSASARAATLATPSEKTDSESSASGAHKDTEEQRHDRAEEKLESRLVWLTAALALIEVGTLFIFWFTMGANIRAAEAANTTAIAARDNLRLVEQDMAVRQR